LSENAFDFAGQTFIVNWFDGETISVTGINDGGRPFVTVWDRCGLPQNIQEVFGTRIPQMKKDISRFFTNDFIRKYGNLPDSIRLYPHLPHRNRIGEGFLFDNAGGCG